jgi:hypothetical protein
VAAQGVSFQGAFSHLAHASLLIVIQGAADGNLVETFANVCAFYVRFDTDLTPDFVKKWSVHSLILAKNTRFGDRGVLEQFWTAIDVHLSSRRSTLSY